MKDKLRRAAQRNRSEFVARVEHLRRMDEEDYVRVDVNLLC